jgi:hypothetical protein
MIGLAYMITNHVRGREHGNSQTKELETSEHKGPSTQLGRSEAAVLGAPWRWLVWVLIERVTGHTAATVTLAQDEWGSPVLTELLFFHLYSIQAPSLLERASHVQPGEGVCCLTSGRRECGPSGSAAGSWGGKVTLEENTKTEDVATCEPISKHAS